MSDLEGPTTVDGEHYFAVIPEWLIGDFSVSDGAFRLYAVLRRYADAKGYAHPYRKTLVERMGGPGRSSLRTVARQIAELSAAGAIVVEQQKRPGRADLGASRYRVMTNARAVVPSTAPGSAKNGTRVVPPMTLPSATSDPTLVTPVARLTDEPEPREPEPRKTLAYANVLVCGQQVDAGPVEAGVSGNGRHPEGLPLGTLIPLDPPAAPIPAKPTRKRTSARGSEDRLLAEAFLEAWQYQHSFYSADDAALPTCQIPNMDTVPKEGGDRWRLVIGVMRWAGAIPGEGAPQKLLDAMAAFMTDWDPTQPTRGARVQAWNADTFCRHVEKWAEKAAHVAGATPR
jgi:hypothetical protein